jgi:hypothetical protein
LFVRLGLELRVRLQDPSESSTEDGPYKWILVVREGYAVLKAILAVCCEQVCKSKNYPVLDFRHVASIECRLQTVSDVIKGGHNHDG